MLAGMLIGGLSAIPCVAQPAAGGQKGETPPRPAPTAGVREIHGQLGGTINTVGVQQSFDVSWRWALSATRHPLLSEAHVAFGGSIAVTPAHFRGGGWVEVAPISIFVIRAGAEPAYYFGTFRSLTSFDSRQAAFDTASLRARGGAVSGTATRLYVTPTLQFRAGPLVGGTSVDFEWWSSSAAGPFFYEPVRDTLLATHGDRLMAVTSVVLYEHRLTAGGRWSTGLMHSITRVNGRSLNQIQRAGVLAIRQFDRRVLGLPRPSFKGSVSYYLDDPSKRREWSAGLAIGFSLSRN